MHDIIAQYLFDNYTDEGEPIPKHFFNAPHDLVEEFMEPGLSYHITAESVRQELNAFVENYYAPD